MKEWVLGSHNTGKCHELNARLTELDVKIHSLSEFTDVSAKEPACTFVENAILKARYASTVSGLPALADDSGLCVPALNGLPGVYSARYSGEGATDEKNIHTLLRDMEHLEGSDRSAFFITVLVFIRAFDDPTPLITEGRWNGSILREKRGSQGFGYNPVFFIPDLNCSAGECSLAVRNQFSHRAIAFDQFKLAFCNKLL